MFSGSIPLELHQEINGVGVGQDRGRSRSEVETSSVSLKRRSMSASTGNFILAVSARGRFTIQRRAFIVSCQLRKQSLNGRVMVTVSGKDIVQGTVLSEVARPRRRNTAGSRVPLEAIFPSAFTDWRADLTAQTFVQPPDEHGKIYGIYDDVLERAYLDRAGLSQDEAWLIISRPGAKHDRRYYLDSRISPAFSSARMIQPITPPAVTAAG